MPIRPVAADHRRRFLQKLASSALDPADAKQLGLELVGSPAARLALPADKAGFLLPYFDLRGKRTKFWRFRYLEPVRAGLLKQAGAKELRYVQAPKTVNELYLPPLVDWARLAASAAEPLLITEGELKAACATKHGLPTIGLGGVWCWRSARAGKPLLEGFYDFQWAQRLVTIVFDSDAATNALVVQAENALARELTRLGAVVRIARLPAVDALAKTGLDDLVATLGVEPLQRAVDRAVPWGPQRELFALNEEVIYVEDPGLVLKLDSLQRLSPRAFIEHAYAPRTYQELVVGAGGATRTVERSAPKEWLKWPLRATVRRATYLPGQPRLVAGELNVWRGWGVEPRPGDVSPWSLLLDYLFKDSPASDRQWFEQWCAYPLQHPGEKLFTAAVMWSRVHGVGKSLVGYTLARIYGANFAEIQDADLSSSFNDWAESRQFVMGDEITGGDKRHIADRLKSMITQRQLRLNIKYVPSYSVPDCVNYFFTSNHPDAFFLEDTDRRFFVHEVKGQPLEHAWYHEVYAPWMQSEEGAAALFYHLLHLDLRGFSPADRAPATVAKREMVEDGRSDLGSWVALLREDPSAVLRLDGVVIDRALWTAPELLAFYDPLQRTRVTANGLARELRRAGFEKTYAGMGVPTTEGQVKLWAIRDAGRWLRATGSQLRAQYEQERGQGNGRAKKF